jgi:photosystem II stability/assembly factor-like uncharacterized protein
MKKTIFTLVTFLFGLNLFAQWVRVTPNPAQESLTAVRFFNDSIGYAVGNGGTILKTANAGTSWSLLTTNTTETFLTIFPTSKDTVYAAGIGGLIIKSIDGGANWTTLNSFTTENIYSLYFISSQTGYAAGGQISPTDTGTIYKTINGGLSWTKVHNAATEYRTVHFINEQVGFAGGSSLNGITQTTDGGQNWQNLTLPNFETNTILSLQFLNANLGYAVGTGGVLYKTMNGGSNWTKITIDSNAILFSAHFTDADTGYAVGSAEEGIIYKTVNGGTTWTNQKFSISVFMRGVYFTPSKTGYVVGRFNGGVAGIWRQQGNFVPTGVETIMNNVFNIYPNPVNNNKLFVEGSDILDIKVFDAKGMNVNFNFSKETNQKLAIELNETSEGLLFLVITTSQGVVRKPIIKK